MTHISEEVVKFLTRQHFVIVSTIDPKGMIHTSCKGIVDAHQNGKVFLLDLYKAMTFRNLKNNSNITLTAVDEHHFKGYAIIGKAKLVGKEELQKEILSNWNKKVVQRISHRMVKHITSESMRKKGLPETKFPEPEYLIEVDVEKIVDLTPAHLM